MLKLSFCATISCILFLLNWGAFGQDDESEYYYNYPHWDLLDFTLRREYHTLWNLRSKFCENGPKGVFLFYHNETQRCHPFMERGPCSESMVIWPIDAFNATCQCPTPDDLWSYLYYNETNQCYLALTSGPCPQGQFLTLNLENKTGCRIDPCGKEQMKDLHVHFEGKCQTLGSICYGLNPYSNVPNDDCEIQINGTEPYCKFLGL